MEQSKRANCKSFKIERQRLLTSSRHDADARPLLSTLGLKKFEDLIETEVGTMVFKALNSLAPENLSNLFLRNSVGSEKYQYRSTTAKENNNQFPTEV